MVVLGGGGVSYERGTPEQDLLLLDVAPLSLGTIVISLLSMLNAYM